MTEVIISEIIDHETCLIKLNRPDTLNSLNKTLVDSENKSLTSLPIKMLTIHTSGGMEMMKAAMEAVSGIDIKVFGVTALTNIP